MDYGIIFFVKEKHLTRKLAALSLSEDDESTFFLFNFFYYRSNEIYHILNMSKALWVLLTRGKSIRMNHTITFRENIGKIYFLLQTSIFGKNQKMGY